MSEVPLYHIRSAEEGQASLASGLSPGLGKGTSGNYWGTLLIRKRTALGPYRRHAPRVLRGSRGGGRFPIGEAPLYEPCTNRGARRCPLFPREDGGLDTRSALSDQPPGGHVVRSDQVVAETQCELAWSSSVTLD